MNYIELHTARMVLGMDRKRAAKLLTHQTPTEWIMYETGLRLVPKRISNTVSKVMSKRDVVIDQLTQFSRKELVLPWYASANVFKKLRKESELDWYIHQSAVAALYAQNRNLKLDIQK